MEACVPLCLPLVASSTHANKARHPLIESEDTIQFIQGLNFLFTVPIDNGRFGGVHRNMGTLCGRIPRHHRTNRMPMENDWF